jgi:hypothetical protein
MDYTWCESVKDEMGKGKKTETKRKGEKSDQMQRMEGRRKEQYRQMYRNVGGAASSGNSPRIKQKLLACWAS